MLGGGGGSGIKIGYLAPLSGPQSVYGEAMEQGLTAAQTQFENGNSPIFDNVTDQEIEVVTEDTEGSPKTGTQVTQRLLNEENVDILAGTVNSSVASGVMALAERNDVPFLITVSLADSLTGEECSRYGFQLLGSTHHFTAPAIPWMLDNLGSSIYMLGNDYSFPKSSNSILRNQVSGTQGEIVGESYVPLGTSDYASSISNVQDSGADVVWASLVGTDSISFLNQAANSGLKEEVEIIGPVVSGDEVVVQGAGEAAVGTYVLENWHYNVENSVSNSFKSSMSSNHGVARPSVYAGAGWETFHLIAHAAAAAGSTNADALIDTFEGLQWNGINGQKLFRASDHAIEQNIYIESLESGGPEGLPARVTEKEFTGIAPPDGCSL